MKTNILLVRAGREAFAAACAVLLCGQSPAQSKPERSEPVLIDDVADRFLSPRELSPRELKEVTYLGVSTHGVDAAMASQLDLPPETGLVVVQIMPDSPAAGVLKEHDLLTRLDDQILIEPRQFGVLVRARKNGDVVKLTLFRGGKEQTVSVTLGKKAMPPLPDRFVPGKGRALSLKGGEPMVFSHGGKAVSIARQPGERRISILDAKDAVMVFDDEEGRLEVNFKEGKKHLTARNKKGEILYNGPVETAEERKALPAEVRARLEKMEAMDVRVPVPPEAPAKIRAPRPPKAGAGAGAFVPGREDIWEIAAPGPKSWEMPAPLPVLVESEDDVV